MVKLKSTTTGAACRVKGWPAVWGCANEALSLFRIALGSLLLLELLLRYRFLRPFYSDEGTLPLRILMDKVDNLYKAVCLHCHFGSVRQQQILLTIQIVIAALFTVGWQTRLTSILSWFMYFSLTLRNTWLNYILDRYFHYLLFLSMFLPVDKCWSVASWRQKRSQQQPADRTSTLVVSPATIALKILVLWIYIDAGVGKFMDPLGGWTYHAYPLPALDTYARHTIVARYLYAAIGPSGLRLLTPTVVYVELLAAPVALLGAYLDYLFWIHVAVTLIVSLHVGIALTIRNASLLSFVACTAWIPFVPIGCHTDIISSNLATVQTGTQSTQVIPRSRLTNQFLRLPLIAITTMVAGNLWFAIFSQECDQSVKHIWSPLLHNRWNVFVGAEEYVTWEIAPGQLQDGSIVDIWSCNESDEINWSLPGSGAPCTATGRPGRWRSFPYLADLKGDEADALWSYLCDEWDREHNVEQFPGRKLVKFNFFMLQADVLPNMTFSETRKRRIVSFQCSSRSSAFNEDRQSSFPFQAREL